ncbi:MAG TPA: hypothetical protein PLL30_00440 [Candidatus Krumholzibacteria bacterium]|nr:hypothetical protein [Candidatus Krumholzibacteria bacterium]HPD70227.1 hypothetical protein [Candidatus Krumholzibacteria bacterium]HRY40073.1 hypothetical protein [Candidatus Krumholzibacteria bacterium]
MRIVLICTAAAALASVGVAASDPPPVCTAWMNHAGHVWVSPAGRGPMLSNAYFPGWPDGVDATIHVRLLDQNGDPIVAYPAEDIWLGAPVGVPFAYCAGGTVADDDTDANGETTISRPLRAGGQVPPTDQPRVFVGGQPIAFGDLPLTVNSPDVNGDLVVDLSDIVFFTQDLLGGGIVDFRHDFNADGVLNLSDVVVLAASLGDRCE